MSLPGYTTTTITWNETKSTDVGNHGVVVEGYPKQYVPERDIEEVDIPGRDYPFLIDNGVYKTYKQSYTLHWLSSDTEAVNDWLFGKVGYGVLKDSFNSERYREAYITGGFSVVNLAGAVCQATVSFVCKPFWYKDISYSFKTSSITKDLNGLLYTPPIVTLTYSSDGGGGGMTISTYCGLEPKGPVLRATFSAKSNVTESVVDCESMTAYMVIDGTKTYLSPTIENGWPRSGYHDGYLYDSIFIKSVSTTNLTSATLAMKRCYLI